MGTLRLTARSKGLVSAVVGHRPSDSHPNPKRRKWAISSIVAAEGADLGVSCEQTEYIRSRELQSWGMLRRNRSNSLKRAIMPGILLTLSTSRLCQINSQTGDDTIGSRIEAVRNRL